MDDWVDFFIPESQIYNPVSFKCRLDLAHLRIRWKVQCSAKAWRNMIEKRLDNFEATKYKEKMLVEKVGVQTQTSSKYPTDPNMRRVVVWQMVARTRIPCTTGGTGPFFVICPVT